MVDHPFLCWEVVHWLNFSTRVNMYDIYIKNRYPPLTPNFEKPLNPLNSLRSPSPQKALRVLTTYIAP